MFVRKMLTSDFSEVLKIEENNFSVPWTSRMFEQEIEKQYAFVCEKKKKVVGYICGWKIVDEFHITNISVKKEIQRNGIGQMLLNHILKNLDRLIFSQYCWK